MRDGAYHTVDLTVQYEKDERENGILEVYCDGEWLRKFVPKLNTDMFTLNVPLERTQVQVVLRHKGQVSGVFTYKLVTETQVIRRETVKVVPIE